MKSRTLRAVAANLAALHTDLAARSAFDAANALYHSISDDSEEDALKACAEFFELIERMRQLTRFTAKRAKRACDAADANPDAPSELETIAPLAAAPPNGEN